MSALTDRLHLPVQDVLAQVMAAAQPNMITAAALRVLQQPHLHTEPASPPEDSRSYSSSKNASQPQGPAGPQTPETSSSSTESAMSAPDGAEHDANGARGEAGMRESDSTSTEMSSDGRPLSEGSTETARRGPWLWLRYYPARHAAHTKPMQACAEHRFRSLIKSIQASGQLLMSAVWACCAARRNPETPLVHKEHRARVCCLTPQAAVFKQQMPHQALPHISRCCGADPA